MQLFTEDSGVSIQDMRRREEDMGSAVEILKQTTADSVHQDLDAQLSVEQEATLLEYFADVECFAGLEKTQQHALVNALQLKTLHEAEILVKKGQDARTHYILLQGMIHEPRSGHGHEDDEEEDWDHCCRYGPLSFIGQVVKKIGSYEPQRWQHTLVAQVRVEPKRRTLVRAVHPSDH